MDAITEQLAKHEARIKEIQNELRSMPKKTEALYKELDQLQKESAIMNQEIKSGKNLD